MATVDPLTKEKRLPPPTCLICGRKWIANDGLYWAVCDCDDRSPCAIWSKPWPPIAI